MDGPFGEANDEEVSEGWFAEHQDLYRELPTRNRKAERRKRKRSKGGRPKRRTTPPVIRVRKDKRRICPSCQHETLADTIKTGQCIPCQVMEFYNSTR